MDVQGLFSSPMSLHPSSQCIPLMIKEKAVTLVASDVIIDIENPSEYVVTIFMGIVDKAFTDDHWNVNLQKITELFHINLSNTLDVKISVNPANERLVNSEQLASGMKRVLDMLNGVTNPISIKCLRIVNLNPAYSPSFDVSVESIIRGWNVPLQKKNIQLVVITDTDDCHWFEFLRTICLQNICNTAQFFNATDYNPYGFLDNRAVVIKSTMKEEIRKQHLGDDEDTEKKYLDDLQRALLLSSSNPATPKTHTAKRNLVSTESSASACGYTKEKQTREKDDSKRNKKEDSN